MLLPLTIIPWFPVPEIVNIDLVPIPLANKVAAFYLILVTSSSPSLEPLPEPLPLLRVPSGLSAEILWISNF
jgi:hypothetical protein